MQHKPTKCTRFKIILNTNFQFLTSSTYFEAHVFILMKTALHRVFVWYVYMNCVNIQAGGTMVHLLDCVYNCLAEDESKGFETRRRRQKL